ncbi:MAG: right-handed parallel beta-helix repeat-containing protein [Clostridia bacterium]|nr:right-handed parallel beta-helix repeat-containing protein [Clostridia bacterium]
MIYYVDNISGASENDGLTPETAVTSYKEINITPGDTILFRRGCVFCEQLKTVSGLAYKPTIYGAYGKGHKPIFSFAFMLDNETLWQQHEKNIWQYTGEIPSEVGNIFFSGGFGMLRWDYNELKTQGDWYYTHIGYTNKPQTYTKEAADAPRALYIYSENNPAVFYNDLKASLISEKYLTFAECNVVFENLHFECSAINGFEGYNGSNVTFKNCDYRYIGGAVWDRNLKIRFGNAIEFWCYCENVIIENCTFDEIYDSCVTTQGKGEYDAPKNIKIINNHFSNYGMAAYELRDKITYNTYFSGNVCKNAGEGICVDYEKGPRRSEIFPQPMGHHIFVWRIDAPTENGFVKISNNVFGKATVGSAIYSIINPEAEKQLLIKNNVFEFDNSKLIKLDNRYYSLKEFKEKRRLV